ncbi:hypothetical protein NN561_017062 [Cricetulus griseus]
MEEYSYHTTKLKKERESSLFENRITPAPATLGPRDEEYSLEQQEQLKQYFELKPYPDLRARRYLATALHLTEEQVQTWFLQRYVEKGMRPPPIQFTVCGNSCPCAYYGLQGHRLRRTLRGTPSWRNRVLPINPSEPSTSFPDTLDPLEEERLWEQQWQLKQYFEKEPYPDLEARRDLATKLGMTEEQVETWFIDQSLEKEMRRPAIQLTAPVNTYSARSRFRSLRSQDWVEGKEQVSVFKHQVYILSQEVHTRCSTKSWRAWRSVGDYKPTDAPCFVNINWSKTRSQLCPVGPDRSCPPGSAAVPGFKS